MDDLTAEKSSVNKRPWYVQELEVGKPTIEIDWSQAQALTIPQEGVHLPPLLMEYVGEQKVLDAMDTGINAIQNGVKKVGSRESHSLVDLALLNGSQPKFVYYSGWREPKFPDVGGPAPIPALVGEIDTHESFNVPKWNGTPEENFAVLKAAMRFYGVGQVASIQLDDNIKKIFYPQDASYMFYNGPVKNYIFEDCDWGYETDTSFVIPNKCRYMVTYTTPMPKEMYRMAPSGVCYAANMSRYRLNQETMASIQMFMKTLGYQALQSAPWPNGICPSPAVGTLSGLGEMDRINQCVVPEEGSVLGIYKFITDMPLPVSKPIDFGAFRFCHTCRKCTELCPANAISDEKDPTWEPQGPWSTPGKKTYFKNEPECKIYQHETGVACQICTGECVFNVNEQAMIHEIVKSTLAVTPVFNGILWQADKLFGYGHHDVASWWDLDAPRYGWSTTMGVRDKGV